MCANVILVSLESSFQALYNDSTLILVFGGVFSLESFEMLPQSKVHFLGNIPKYRPYNLYG